MRDTDVMEFLLFKHLININEFICYVSSEDEISESYVSLISMWRPMVGVDLTIIQSPIVDELQLLNNNQFYFSILFLHFFGCWNLEVDNKSAA